MPTPTASVKVNPLTGALIDPIAATFASANGFLTGGTSDAKDSVVCATTANGTLATAFENGDTVDGITLATGNRILIKNQSSQAENGIYTVNASGAPTRATDFDAWTEIVGAFVTVESGTVNAGTQWLCNVVSGGTLNTTAITFVVPKNFVDLTTTQTVTGAKTFNNITGSVIESTTIGVTTPAAGWFTLVNGLYISVGSGASLGISGDLGVSFDAPATESIIIRSAASSDVTLPASGTLATTTGNVATATALATARNIFNISFNGTANVDGDATNTGHFASIPGTGAAGNFVTQNGTAPTVIAGRSAWYSDGSGVPSFKNGTGTPVTLVRSSDLGTGIATFLATPSSANLAAAVTDETGSGALVFGTSPTLTTPRIASGGFIADENGNEQIIFTTAASAVNEITISNGASGTNPSIAATGGGTNISLRLLGKGTGCILFPDGSAGLPGLGFNNDTNTGIYRTATDSVGIAAGGVLQFTVNTTGATAAGTLAVTGATTLTGNLTSNGALISTPQALTTAAGTGAVNLTTLTTEVTTTGVLDALTLANGTAGQIKTIIHKAGAFTSVLTPTTALGFTSITFLASLGQTATLQYTSAGWVILAVGGSTLPVIA